MPIVPYSYEMIIYLFNSYKFLKFVLKLYCRSRHVAYNMPCRTRIGRDKFYSDALLLWPVSPDGSKTCPGGARKSENDIESEQ